MLTLASSQNKDNTKKSTYSPKAMEVIVITLASIILFLITMDSGLPGPFSPVAILMPALVGVGYRYFSKHLPIRKAVAESIPHIIISALFLIVVILAFI